MTAHPAEPPWYGPVCPVVWEGRRREAPPYPDQLPQGPSVCDKMAPGEGMANWTAGVLGLQSTRE